MQESIAGKSIYLSIHPSIHPSIYLIHTYMIHGIFSSNGHPGKDEDPAEDSDGMRGQSVWELLSNDKTQIDLSFFVRAIKPRYHIVPGRTRTILFDRTSDYSI